MILKDKRIVLIKRAKHKSIPTFTTLFHLFTVVCSTIYLDEDIFRMQRNIQMQFPEMKREQVQQLKQVLLN